MKITEQNHHNDLANILRSESLRQIACRGIIHIGAHEGEEVGQYLAHGFGKIILIEANPHWCEILLRKFGHDTRIKIFNYAICDRNGVIDLHIHTSRSGSTEPASILPMKRFKEIVRTLHTPNIVPVTAITLDSLFESEVLDIAEYNFINIDIQGAELLAFRGAPKALAAVDVVISEVNLLEMYEGSPLEGEIVKFLDSHGFEKKDVVYHTLYDESSTFPAWGECLFVKRAPRR